MTLFYRCGWHFWRTFYEVCFRWRIYNSDRVPRKGGALIASNHASHFDPPLVGTALPREIHYLARESLFSIPVVGPIIRRWNAVPVDRDGGGGRGLKSVLKCVKGGGAIILFPEGTRTPDGALQPARSGIGLTVIKSTVPVVPVRVFGTYEAFSRKMIIPRFFLAEIAVKYGRPMDFKGLREEAKTCSKPRLKEIYQEVTDQIMAAIAALEPVQDPD